MPDFTFTSPEGKNYTVSGPPGATKEQAFQILQAQIAAPRQGTDTVPELTPEGGVKHQEVEPDTSGVLDRLFGAGEAGLSMATAPFGVAAGTLAGASDMLGGALGGTGKAVPAFKQAASQFTYAPRSEKGKEYLGKAANFMSAMPPIVPELPAMGAAARAAGEASGAGRLATRAGEAARSVLPKVDPQVAVLAKKAEGMGIPLRPDMLTDNQVVRIMGDALEKVPLSGSQGPARATAFNKAVMRQIGADPAADRLTPEVFSKAVDASGKTIGDIASRYQLAVDRGLEDQLLKHLADAASTATPDVEKVVNGYVASLLDKVQGAMGGGAVDGKAWREWNTKIQQQIRTTNNGDLRNALGELQRDVMRSMRRGIAVKDAAKFDEARKQYANAIALEPVVAKSTTGDLSPSSVFTQMTNTRGKQRMMARGQGGEMADVARVGRRFVQEPSTSHTAEREMAYKALGTAGAVATGAAVPHAAPVVAGVYGIANLYNRLAPSLAKTEGGRRLLVRMQERIAAEGKQVPLGAPVAQAITSNQPETEDQ